MLRYVLYVAIVFVIVDHVFTHYGPEIINWLASSFLGRDVVVVEEAPYRQSLIDKVVENIKERLGDE